MQRSDTGHKKWVPRAEEYGGGPVKTVLWHEGGVVQGRGSALIAREDAGASEVESLSLRYFTSGSSRCGGHEGKGKTELPVARPLLLIRNISSVVIVT